jgi:hypothetical protein
VPVAVSGIHDGIHLFFGDIALHNFELLTVFE